MATCDKYPKEMENLTQPHMATAYIISKYLQNLSYNLCNKEHNNKNITKLSNCYIYNGHIDCYISTLC
jgi:hypothetical protein